MKPDRPILLNPGPGTTSQAVKDAMMVDDICPRESAFGDVMMRITQDLETLTGQPDLYETALFAASGTGAVEAVFASAMTRGSKVLILTNGAYGFRMREIATRYGIPIETRFEYGQAVDPNVVDEALKVGRFTHVAMVHHETSTGMMNPFEAVCDAAHRHGATLVLDAMSSFGAYPFDVGAHPVDYLCASSNKCIQGMPGLAFVLFHRNRIDELSKGAAGLYFDIHAQWSGLKRNHQLRYTPPVQVCYAFEQALKETLAEGVPARWDRYRTNYGILREGMLGLGFRLFCAPHEESHILMAFHPDANLPRGFGHFHDHLLGRGITVYPGVIPETNTFRMGVIGDLHPDDMRRVIREVGTYLATVR